MSGPKLAFVIPWFGFDIPGGAESHCREMALHLVERGFEVEVLTTCVREFASNWNVNHHSPGTQTENGIKIRRFRVTQGNHEAFNYLNQKLLAGCKLSEEEERVFLAEIISSDDLNRYIRENRRDYYYFFMPYMFGTSYWGTQVAPERSVLIPCLHDEPYAYLRGVEKMFESVRAILFNSPAEFDLALDLYDLSQVETVLLGEGVETEFRPSENCPVPSPFLLYLGRKDSSKNADLLVQYFHQYKERRPGPLALVLAGSGSVPLETDIIDLGFVSREDRDVLLKEALCLCQPSVRESFSKVIMEAWLNQTPVLVHGDCAVTRDHASRSHGGVWFHDYYDFEAALDIMTKRPQVARELAISGREYVRANYTWPIVMARFESWFAGIAASA